MKHTIYSLLLIALFGMTRMQAWADDLTTTEIDGVTYYEIANGDDLVAFSTLVNGGEFNANAIMTADIDMSEQDSWTAIGDWGTVSGTSNAGYKGHFDGQGHAIENFNFDAIHNYFALFGVVSTGALIENFSIEGSINVGSENIGYAAGIVAYARDNTPTIRNVQCKVDINSTSTAGTPRLGGIVGGCPQQNSKVVIDRCSYSGTLNANDKGGNYGGIIGYILNNTNVSADITNCLFDGKLQSTVDTNTAQFGGIIGYTRKGIVSVKNCLSIGTIEFKSGNAENIGQFVGRITYDSGTTGITLTNNYYKDMGNPASGTSSGGQGNGTAPVEVTDEQLGSGEACYLLNGNQEEIAWFQTLGTDDMPSPFGTGIVYISGRQHCDGTPYDDVVYSNDQAGSAKDDHDFQNGFCTYCNTIQEDYLTANTDGFYEIANESQLVWFTALVQDVKADANAVLTDDIEFSKPWTTPIGTASLAYAGIFDGQGHSLSAFEATSAGKGGLFGYTNGATVRNFSISGTLSATTGTGSGVVGWAEKSTITDIHSNLVIDVPISNVHHVGGVVGSAQGGNSISRCSFSGSLTVEGSTDNFAGVVAYLGGDSVTNCANYGTVTFSETGCAAGGVAGYLNNTTTYIMNCLNTGLVACSAGSTPKYGGAIIGRIKNNWSSARVKDNYWLEGSAYGPSRKDDGTSPLAASAEGTNADDMASGEVAWALNGESFINVVWHQSIGQDDYPMLQGDDAIVYQTSDGFESFSPSDASAFATFLSTVINGELAFIETTACYQELLDQYKEAVETWQNVESYEDFCAQYLAAQEKREAVEQSAALYEEYKKACEFALTYMEENELQGDMADFLKNYLNENQAGSSDYPNGTYAYILETLGLDDEAITAETAFVNQMLENAIAGGITSGTEITRLIANSTFTSSFDGWQTETDGMSLATGGTTEVMPIARALGNGTANISQTLNDMPNGIYLMTLNGMFRAGADITSQFYAGQLYLNGTVNYFMSPGEDVIPDYDAEDKVNCDRSSDAEYVWEDIQGYVPASIGGCSYAYNAGRYLNYCATEVTDGNLTVGVRNLGTGLDSDWMPFGGLHVYYLGTADEADEKLTDVLEAYTDRAQTIVDFIWSEYEDYAQFPNISESLKTDLEDAISEASDADTGEKKMALINRFSELFNEVHACRKAYIKMLGTAYKLFDFLDLLQAAELITSDEYDQWEMEVNLAQGNYSAGDVSTEEALAIAERLNIAATLLPVEDGIYQLSTINHLKLFSTIVGSMEPEAKAVLTSDIDMSELDYFEPIGSVSTPFSGEFDGQNHKISNFTFETVSGDRQGLFGNVKDATIQNFSIDGDITYYGGTGIGVVGWSEGSTVIRNVHSALNISVVEVSHHIGGVVGSMRSGTKVVGSSFSGSITETAGSHDCLGGIAGYSNEYCAIENCANYGSISFTAENAYAGGILGYLNNALFEGIKNCLSVGNVQREVGSATYAGAIGGRIRNNTASTFQNNYWLSGSAGRTSGENAINGTAVDAEKLKSGEICYSLNGDQSEINWYQTIAVDDYPVLFPDHLRVWFYDDQYTNVDPDAIADVKASESEHTGIYNLAGQRLGKLQKGINIVGGKKILVK